MDEVHHTTDSKIAAFHEVTVIAGSARRRRWSAEEKARIVSESLDPAVSVSAVAQRHGLNPNQLYGWRRQFRQEGARRYAKAGDGVGFNGGAATSACATRIEVVVGKMLVRVPQDVETAALRRVLRVVHGLT
jgi:transposase